MSGRYFISIAIATDVKIKKVKQKLKVSSLYTPKLWRKELIFTDGSLKMEYALREKILVVCKTALLLCKKT